MIFYFINFKLFSNGLFILLFFILLAHFVKTNEKDLLVEDSIDYKSLYSWSDSLDGAHRLINVILKDKGSKSVLNNLEQIRNALFHYSEYDSERLKLLKIYLKTYLQKKDKKLYFSTLSTVALGLITLSITKILEGKTPEFLERIFISLEPVVLIPFLILLAIFWGLIGLRGDTRIRLFINMIEEYENEDDGEKIKKWLESES